MAGERGRPSTVVSSAVTGTDRRQPSKSLLPPSIVPKLNLAYHHQYRAAASRATSPGISETPQANNITQVKDTRKGDYVRPRHSISPRTLTTPKSIGEVPRTSTRESSARVSPRLSLHSRSTAQQEPMSTRPSRASYSRCNSGIGVPSSGQRQSPSLAPSSGTAAQSRGRSATRQDNNNNNPLHMFSIGRVLKGGKQRAKSPVHICPNVESLTDLQACACRQKEGKVKKEAPKKWDPKVIRKALRDELDKEEEERRKSPSQRPRICAATAVKVQEVPVLQIRRKQPTMK